MKYEKHAMKNAKWRSRLIAATFIAAAISAAILLLRALPVVSIPITRLDDTL